MAMRIMLRTGLRVSECLSLCPADLRLSHDPPIISLRPDVEGNKAEKGREVPVPADMVESLVESLASKHAKKRHRPIFDISRQWVSKSMKEAAVTAGLDPARAHLREERRPGGSPDAGPAVLAGSPAPFGDRAVREAVRRNHEWAERL